MPYHPSPPGNPNGSPGWSNGIVGVVKMIGAADRLATGTSFRWRMGARRVRTKIQNLHQVRSQAVEVPLRVREEGERKGPKPLAVGIKDAAKMLGLSPPTIRQYVARGRIRAVRIGRQVLVPVGVLDKVRGRVPA